MYSSQNRSSSDANPPQTGELYTRKLEQRAYYALEQGYLTNARYLFEEIVQRNPRNVRAWRALIDLWENVDERVTACRRVLDLEPFDDAVRATLETLERQQEHTLQQKQRWVQVQTARAQALLREGKTEDARCLLQTITKTYPHHAAAWWLLAEQSDDDIEQRIHALREAVRCQPDNRTFQTVLTRWEYLRDHPEELVAMYEADGRWEQALRFQHAFTLQSRSLLEWERRRRDVLRLENLRQAAPPHISRLSEIARLTLWPLFPYLLLFWLIDRLSLLALALDPFFLGSVVLALLGGFLLAVLEMRADDILWRRWPLGGDHTAYRRMRIVVGILGRIAIGLPLVLWLFDALF
ncbi:MAG: hypothetical protein Fur0018_12390 [Anaerolineales bacterium]